MNVALRVTDLVGLPWFVLLRTIWVNKKTLDPMRLHVIQSSVSVLLPLLWPGGSTSTYTLATSHNASRCHTCGAPWLVKPHLYSPAVYHLGVVHPSPANARP